MHFSMQVEFHTPLMTFDASNNVTYLTSPNPHCTFLNLLHLPEPFTPPYNDWDKANFFTTYYNDQVEMCHEGSFLVESWKEWN